MPPPAAAGPLLPPTAAAVGGNSGRCWRHSCSATSSRHSFCSLLSQQLLVRPRDLAWLPAGLGVAAGGSRSETSAPHCSLPASSPCAAAASAALAAAALVWAWRWHRCGLGAWHHHACAEHAAGLGALHYASSDQTPTLWFHSRTLQRLRPASEPPPALIRETQGPPTPPWRRASGWHSCSSLSSAAPVHKVRSCSRSRLHGIAMLAPYWKRFALLSATPLLWEG